MGYRKSPKPAPHRTANGHAAAPEINIDIRGVVYREGPWWIAHCLELDVPAEGDTPAAAMKSAIELCVFQVREAMKDGDLRSIFRPAPPELWELYARSIPTPSGKPVANGSMRLTFRELAAA